MNHQTKHRSARDRARDIIEDYSLKKAIWLESTVIDHTPKWAHFIAQAVQYRGLAWAGRVLLPLVRRFVQVSITTETNTRPAGKGFRKSTIHMVEHVQVFKRGKLIAQKTFQITSYKS